MKVTNGNNSVGLHNITSFGVFNILAVYYIAMQLLIFQ